MIFFKIKDVTSNQIKHINTTSRDLSIKNSKKYINNELETLKKPNMRTDHNSNNNKL